MECSALTVLRAVRGGGLFKADAVNREEEEEEGGEDEGFRANAVRRRSATGGGRFMVLHMVLHMEDL